MRKAQKEPMMMMPLMMKGGGSLHYSSSGRDGEATSFQTSSSVVIKPTKLEQIISKKYCNLFLWIFKRTFFSNLIVFLN